MIPYDNIDIALIFAGCNEILEVMKCTELFQMVWEETGEVNLNLVREFSNRRVRQLVWTDEV